jgi:hypothetical protein
MADNADAASGAEQPAGTKLIDHQSACSAWGPGEGLEFQCGTIIRSLGRLCRWSVHGQSDTYTKVVTSWNKNG